MHSSPVKGSGFDRSLIPIIVVLGILVAAVIGVVVYMAVTQSGGSGGGPDPPKNAVITLTPSSPTEPPAIRYKWALADIAKSITKYRVSVYKEREYDTKNHRKRQDLVLANDSVQEEVEGVKAQITGTSIQLLLPKKGDVYIAHLSCAGDDGVFGSRVTKTFVYP
jgi:hypothetical protein